MNAEPNRFFNQRNRLRVTNPPGGRSNDIFNTSSAESTPSNSPQKTKNYAKSQIFSDNNDTDANGNNVKKHRSMSPRHFDNTKDRLFGTPESSPRRSVVSDTYRSNVFNGECHKNAATDSPKKKAIIVNPITGEALSSQNISQGIPNGYKHENGHQTGSIETNGIHSN